MCFMPMRASIIDSNPVFASWFERLYYLWPQYLVLLTISYPLLVSYLISVCEDKLEQTAPIQITVGAIIFFSCIILALVLCEAIISFQTKIFVGCLLLLGGSDLLMPNVLLTRSVVHVLNQTRIAAQSTLALAVSGGLAS